MALFRRHLGVLAEGLLTTVIVDDIDQLADKLECGRGDLEIKPYPSASNNFDKRIGWFTHIVIKTENNQKYVTGYLSEAIKMTIDLKLTVHEYVTNLHNQIKEQEYILQQLEFVLTEQLRNVKKLLEKK